MIMTFNIASLLYIGILKLKQQTPYRNSVAVYLERPRNSKYATATISLRDFIMDGLPLSLLYMA